MLNISKDQIRSNLLELLDNESNIVHYQLPKHLEINDDILSFLDALLNTSDNILVHGKAGTGKSVLLRLLKLYLDNYLPSALYKVAAPTGIAAINVGGSSIHTTFKLPIPLSPTSTNNYSLRRLGEDGKKCLSMVDFFILDEVSMIHDYLIDNVDSLMRIVNQSKEVMGGARVILFGDLYQLPPVFKFSKENKDLDLKLKKEYWNAYGPGEPMFTKSKFWSESKIRSITLEHVYRQNDLDFVNVLNHIRKEKPNFNVLFYLNAAVKDNDLKNPIILCNHNDTMNRINNKKLSSLKNPKSLYNTLNLLTKDEEEIEFCKNYFASEGYNYPIKVADSARIMITVNHPVMYFDSVEDYYNEKDVKSRIIQNGLLGKILDITDDYIAVVLDHYPDKVFLIKNYVETIKRDRIITTLNLETNKEQSDIVHKKISDIHFWPLKLAYAITVHKSQGQTFDEVYYYNEKPFRIPGLSYVALSRVRDFTNLRILQSLSQKDLVPAVPINIDTEILDLIKQLDYHRKIKVKDKLVEIIKNQNLN